MQGRAVFAVLVEKVNPRPERIPQGEKFFQVDAVGGVVRTGRPGDHQGGVGVRFLQGGGDADPQFDVLAAGDARRQEHERLRFQEGEFRHQAAGERFQFEEGGGVNPRGDDPNSFGGNPQKGGQFLPAGGGNHYITGLFPGGAEQIPGKSGVHFGDVEGILPGEIVTPGNQAHGVLPNKAVQGGGERQVLVEGDDVVGDDDRRLPEDGAELGRDALLHGGELRRNETFPQLGGDFQDFGVTRIDQGDVVEGDALSLHAAASGDDVYPMPAPRQETGVPGDGALHAAEDGRRGVVEDGDGIHAVSTRPGRCASER